MKKDILICLTQALIILGCSSGTVSSNEDGSSESDKIVLTRADVQEEYIKDDRDGETYRIVKIGNQWWMAENLRYAVDSSLCYNRENYFCETYGRLYPWIIAMNLDTIYYRKGAIYDDVIDCYHQGVCPMNWHIPTKVEWETMINFIQMHNGTEGDGTSLRSSQMWAEYKVGETMVTHSDRFGFSILPAGFHKGPVLNDDGYEEFTRRAFFWTATEVNSFRNDVAKSYYVMIDGYRNDNAALLYGNKSKIDALSIRCIKN